MTGHEARVRESRRDPGKESGRGGGFDAGVGNDHQSTPVGEVVNRVPDRVVQRERCVGGIELDGPHPQVVDGPLQLGRHGFRHQRGDVGKADEAIGMALHKARGQVVAGAAVGMKDVEEAALVDADGVHGSKHFIGIVPHARAIPAADVPVKIDHPGSGNHRSSPSFKIRSRFPEQSSSRSLVSRPRWCSENSIGPMA